MAAVGALLYLQLPIAALAMMIQTLLYLRPGELCSMKTKEWLAPYPQALAGVRFWCVLLHSDNQDKASKTNERDKSLMFNSVGFSWMEKELATLAAARNGSELLWPFSQEQYSEFVATAASLTGQADLVPYSFRHAGASHDLLTRSRSAEEVKQRGRWRTDGSLKHYGKPAKALQAQSRLRPAILEYGMWVDSHIGLIFQGEVLAPCPPMIGDQ